MIPIAETLRKLLLASAAAALGLSLAGGYVQAAPTCTSTISISFPSGSAYSECGQSTSCATCVDRFNG
jgi:hypothetical protein